MKILITGAAGFIGFHVAQRYLSEGHSVVGADNLTEYYDVSLKKSRLAILTESARFHFQNVDVSDRTALEAVFSGGDFGLVIHLAAQAGVRYSITNPHAYIASNIVGFGNILECCRHADVPHLVYASSSSVYGSNRKLPFAVEDNVDHPVSLYAATKKSNELMAHTYSHLFGLPTTGLRLFTVYGPWGRPDMAWFLFTDAILRGEPIRVFNHGDMKRDFTYVDDVVEGVVRAARPFPRDTPDTDGPGPTSAAGKAPYRLYNLGNNKPVPLLDFISVLEEALGVPAKRELLPMQPGDVPVTYADMSAMKRDFDFEPTTSIREGIPRFVRWYRDYYHA